MGCEPILSTSFDGCNRRKMETTGNPLHSNVNAFGIGNVAPQDFCPRWYVFERTRRQVVQNTNLVTLFDQGAGQVRSYKPSSPGNEVNRHPRKLAPIQYQK